MDTFKPGNIVSWGKQKSYYVVLYVATPNWKDSPHLEGKKFARLSWSEDCAMWVPVEELTLMKDTRSRKRAEQYQFLKDYYRENPQKH